MANMATKQITMLRQIWLGIHVLNSSRVRAGKKMESTELRMAAHMSSQKRNL